MPNHVHLVLIPSIGSKIGPIIGEIKRISARQIHQWLKSFGSDLLPRLHVTRRGALKFAFWQKRCFDHNCRSEEVVWTKVKYCHNNPVKWGLVRTPGDWKWSSYACYFGKSDVVLKVDFEGCPI
jgi:putative transposase